MTPEMDKNCRLILVRRMRTLLILASLLTACITKPVIAPLGRCSTAKVRLCVTLAHELVFRRPDKNEIRTIRTLKPIGRCVVRHDDCGRHAGGREQIRLIQQNNVFAARNLLKRLLQSVFAVVLSLLCFIPAPASAYYYRGHYYRYSYRGHYYRYHYRGHYYRHRAWVVVGNGRPGYYRYW